jgi:hypothetical protein
VAGSLNLVIKFPLLVFAHNVFGLSRVRVGLMGSGDLETCALNKCICEPCGPCTIAFGLSRARIGLMGSGDLETCALNT